MSERETASTKYPRIRVSVIVIEDGKILLVRHEKHGKSYWVLPGGGVDFSESLEEAAVRELKEETNLDVKIDKLVFVNDSLPEDLHRHVVNAYFTAAVTGGEPRMGTDSNIREVRWFPIEELANVTFYPDIADQIVDAYRNGFPNHALYLGNLWD